MDATDHELNEVLKISGENRNELLEVLDHYKSPSDSLKYRAAIFLIRNMKYHRTYSGESLKRYDTFFETIKPIRRNRSLSPRLREDMTKNIYDSLEMQKATSSLQLIEDATYLKSSYLIENIDLAFKAWKTYPWSLNVAFEDFCKYILPYKISTEPVQSWRKAIMDKYGWVEDSIQNPGNLREATILINKTIRDSISLSSVMNELPLAVSFENLQKGKIGRCEHMVTLNLYLLRALGIPARSDYVPLWGNANNGHSWCSITEENGNIFAFDAIYYVRDTTDSLHPGVSHMIPESLLRNRRAPKIYALTYQKHNENLLPREIVSSGIYPDQFMNIHRMDITSSYKAASADIEIKLDANFEEEVAYLCIYNNNQWRLSSFGHQTSSGLYKFRNMGCGIVYLPVSYSHSGIKYEAPPFVFTETGLVKSLKPDYSSLRTIVIDRKYHMDYHVLEALEAMIGGIFQGANFKDFRDADNLHEIDTIPVPKTNHFEVAVEENYRYLRFILPRNQCRVAEIRFFGRTIDSKDMEANNTVVPLTGQLISSKHREINSADRIIDGDVLTYFVSEDDSGGWVGLDLGIGNKARITKIEFYPPNDGNSVEIGDEYELMYWSNGWSSLGVQVALEEKLTFRKCPANVLFVLKNRTKGKQERIFTFEDNSQVWW